MVEWVSKNNFLVFSFMKYFDIDIDVAIDIDID